MPTLTSLAPDPRWSDYRVVHLDRGRFASLPVEALEALGLEVGRELAPGVLEQLRTLADAEAAYRAALRALARRPLARLDLRRRLVQKQHPPAAVERALARLESRGLLDDARFATQYAATRATRGRGPARLLRDLLAQGVDRRVAEDGVQRGLAQEGVDPAAAARALVERRARHLAGLPALTRRRRLAAYLARRGFGGESALKLIDEVCSE